MIFIPSEIAAADSTVEVIEAAVSNLESNATAGKSALKIVSPTNDKAIYIPESYFLQYEGIYAGDIHKVTYLLLSGRAYSETNYGSRRRAAFSRRNVEVEGGRRRKNRHFSINRRIHD